MPCNSSDPPTYCSAASPELKLYQAFIFLVPVFFTCVLVLLFYFFYLRHRRANWQSTRMRASRLEGGENPRSLESGIRKEVREMLPVVVFKESFLIRETQCSVCLGEYESDERLQRIPPCGHTFHVDCIDHWLTTNTTCPLCRVSLLATKAAAELENYEVRTTEESEELQASVGGPDPLESLRHVRREGEGFEDSVVIDAHQQLQINTEGNLGSGVI